MREQTTKEELKTLIKVWPNAKSLEEVAQATGRGIQWVRATAKRIRDAGYDLPKIKKESRLTEWLKEIAAGK